MLIIYEYLESIKQAALFSLCYLWKMVNSQFGVAATGSFFGAVGGYFIVMITNHRNEIFSKIERLQTAIALSHSLFNLAYSVNKQHVYALLERYENGKKDFIDARAKNIPGFVFTVQFDNTKIFAPYIDFELITSKLLKETGFAGRAFVLATVLISCLYSLRDLLQQRVAALDEINSIAAKNNLDVSDKACLYYGITIKRPQGNIEYTVYLDLMKGIKNATLDCMWFSRELVTELIEIARIGAKKIYYKRPKINSADYSEVDKKYMPDDNQYIDWREKFNKA